MSPTPTAQSNVAYCADLVRGADFERYAATLFVGPDPRRALLAVFAFNIEIARVRDQISQPLAGEIRLQWWSDLVAGLAHGDAAGNPVAAELLHAIDQHALPHALVTRMIDAHRFDLYDQPMRTRTELESYLEGTAAALFELGARVLAGEGQPDAELLRHAGLAFGLTRIVEALPAHASRGQIVLPLDEFDQAGVVADDVLAGNATPHLQAYLRDVASRARQHLSQALELMAGARGPARSAFLPLALLDRKLKRMTSADYQPLKPPAPASNLGVLWTLWRASWREPFRT
jgi:phytoene synthase